VIAFCWPGDFVCYARQPANTSEEQFPRDRALGQQQSRSLWRWWRADDNRLWGLEFDRASLKPITQLMPSFILIKADQAHTLALHNTMQALASEMAEQAPGSEVVTNRLAEGLFIQTLRAHIASRPERFSKGWLRAIFDPQMGTALSAIHDSVNTPWTVESLAEAAGMSRSAFAARFKLLGQTPLEYVTEWRMQKAMQLLQQRDKKLIDVARSVGYESDAAFSKAFKRVVGASPGEHLKTWC
jgi:AraC-like DNA-binding protein